VALSVAEVLESDMSTEEKIAYLGIIGVETAIPELAALELLTEAAYNLQKYILEPPRPDPWVQGGTEGAGPGTEPPEY
jgi:hypothetical protein